MKLLSNLLKLRGLSAHCPCVNDNKCRADKGKEEENPHLLGFARSPSGCVYIPEPCVTERNSCFALDAPTGSDWDPSSFYRTTGNQQPPGLHRAVRNALGDRGQELDLSSGSDNMTRVVVRSEPPTPRQLFCLEGLWERTFQVSTSACCGVFFILRPVLSLFTRISPNKVQPK